MRRALALSALVLGFGICVGAQAPAAPARSDPYAGSVKSRVYSSSFFGFSCEIPKGLQSQAEWIEKLRKNSALKTKSSLDTIEAQYKHWGVLLQATRMEDAGKMMDAFRQPLPDPMHPPAITIDSGFSVSFVITASPIAASGGPEGAMEVAENRAAQVRANNPGIVVSAPGRVVLNGQEFARLDASQPPPEGKHKSGWFASDFVAVRDGYILQFVFSADTEKELVRVIKTMETLHFQSP